MHRTLHSPPGILLQFSGSTLLKGEVRERESERERERASTRARASHIHSTPSSAAHHPSFSVDHQRPIFLHWEDSCSSSSSSSSPLPSSSSSLPLADPISQRWISDPALSPSGTTIVLSSPFSVPCCLESTGRNALLLALCPLPNPSRGTHPTKRACVIVLGGTRRLSHFGHCYFHLIHLVWTGRRLGFHRQPNITTFQPAQRSRSPTKLFCPPT